nr:immunoglobulin heavy chain junction region [Macaca mulatta]
CARLSGFYGLDSW